LGIKDLGNDHEGVLRTVQLQDSSPSSLLVSAASRGSAYGAFEVSLAVLAASPIALGPLQIRIWYGWSERYLCWSAAINMPLTTLAFDTKPFTGPFICDLCIKPRKCSSHLRTCGVRCEYTASLLRCTATLPLHGLACVCQSEKSHLVIALPLAILSGVTDFSVWLWTVLHDRRPATSRQFRM
jgi:hypothetical protein